MKRLTLLLLGACLVALVALAACSQAPSPNQATPGPACVSPGTSPPPGARPSFSPRYCR